MILASLIGFSSLKYNRKYQISLRVIIAWCKFCQSFPPTIIKEFVNCKHRGSSCINSIRVLFSYFFSQKINKEFIVLTFRDTLSFINNTFENRISFFITFLKFSLNSNILQNNRLQILSKMYFVFHYIRFNLSLFLIQVLQYSFLFSFT